MPVAGPAGRRLPVLAVGTLYMNASRGSGLRESTESTENGRYRLPPGRLLRTYRIDLVPHSHLGESTEDLRTVTSKNATRDKYSIQ